MFQNLGMQIKNAPLGRKILFLLLPGILLLSFFTFMGFLLIIRTSNHLLYQTSGELLAYSSRDISQNLTSIKNMADFILEDNIIQNNLSKTKDAPDEAIPSGAYSEVLATLDSYYQRYKVNYVDYIQIINTKFSTSRTSIDSHVLPQELQQDLIKKAYEADGRICWITDYCDTYGLFLVRSIRRIDHMKLDDLGVLLININMQKMIDHLSINHSTPESTAYLVCSDDRIVCASPSLKNVRYEELPSSNIASYAIITLNGKRYFTVGRILEHTNWPSYCFSPYDSMYNNILFFQKLFLMLLPISFFLCIFLANLLLKPLMQHFGNLMIKIKDFGNENFEIAKFPYSYENRHDEIGLLHQQFDAMAYKIQTLIRENYENKLLAKESQLKALEMQINPHFLYNTLESINWRAKMLKDRQISSMTESLGKLLRITLSKKTDDSSLQQELELVRYYMNIQQIHYEDQLLFSVQVPNALLDTYLPKFTLQPLVENAIRYTLEEDSDECQIFIQAHRLNSKVIITIANSDSCFEEEFLSKLIAGKILPNGFGIGILNVNKRLELAFGSQYQLDFYNENEYAIVQITIPYMTQRDDRKERTHASLNNSR